MDGVFSAAEEALGLWIETARAGQGTIPVLRDLSELKDDPDWTRSFADATLVMAMPSPVLGMPETA